MKVSGPITMRLFSASEPVFEAELDASSIPPGQIGVVAVSNVRWSEMCGEKVMLNSERWKLLAPNMWLVMSQKK